MRVFVYRNLHRKCLSVKSLESGIVIAHLDSISLKNCRFKVSAKGRQRVLNEKRKNVHAGVEGDWVKRAKAPNLEACTRIVYDPYKFDTFVEEKTLTPWHESERAFVTIRGAFVDDTITKTRSKPRSQNHVRLPTTEIPSRRSNRGVPKSRSNRVRGSRKTSD